MGAERSPGPRLRLVVGALRGRLIGQWRRRPLHNTPRAPPRTRSVQCAGALVYPALASVRGDAIGPSVEIQCCCEWNSIGSDIESGSSFALWPSEETEDLDPDCADFVGIGLDTSGNQTCGTLGVGSHGFELLGGRFGDSGQLQLQGSIPLPSLNGPR